MKIFLAGATGAVGKALVPMLVARGHEVYGTTRSASKSGLLTELGAQPVVVDALDRDAVTKAVAGVGPEVVVHQLTAIDNDSSFRNPDKDFSVTNRLRTEGLDTLLHAAVEAGARRFVAQSFTGWPNEHRGGWVKTEDDPLEPNPIAGMRETLAAIRHVETAMTGATTIEGIALRYGYFYGPGNALGPAGRIVTMIRARQLPIVGGGTGTWSFLHIHDAATATVAAVEAQVTGVYNIADDEPAPVNVWLPYLAELLGAKPPMRVPAWLGRLLAGGPIVEQMTVNRGSSNAKARRDLGWQPSYLTWREGFRALA
jgi:nucleoside-diphosphate-sugar epimerase